LKLENTQEQGAGDELGFQIWEELALGKFQ